MRTAIAFVTLALSLLATLAARPARAAPQRDATSDEDRLDEALSDGDIDEEDRAVLPYTEPGSRTAGGPADSHAQSWASLVGFGGSLGGGRYDVGAGLVVAFALDRVAEGPVHRLASPPASPAPPADPPAPALVAPAMATACVAAALRAAGLGVDDARIDGLEDRARASAALPETRLRAMRLWTDASHATTLATAADATDYYAAVGANLILEARLTWRLDRLLFAGDEPSLERVRLQRIAARFRVAERTLEGLFAWARARLDADEALAGSREATEAELRAAEAVATLDVLTGGWFSEAVARQAGPR
ncbi:MAG: hypothetical protein FWD17_17295 [Polyangiaceae bacterium]|nr:hypothetical protein [Polyangiaceae bacterium]